MSTQSSPGLRTFWTATQPAYSVRSKKWAGARRPSNSLHQHRRPPKGSFTVLPNTVIANRRQFRGCNGSPNLPVNVEKASPTTKHSSRHTTRCSRHGLVGLAQLGHHYRCLEMHYSHQRQLLPLFTRPLLFSKAIASFANIAGHRCSIITTLHSSPQ